MASLKWLISMQVVFGNFDNCLVFYSTLFTPFLQRFQVAPLHALIDLKGFASANRLL